MKKKCIIMGNGPSLNDIDIQKLKGIDTFSVNRAYEDYEKWDFHPTYYSLLDWWTIQTIKDELVDFIKKDDKIEHFFIWNEDGTFDFDDRVHCIMADTRTPIFKKGQWVDGIPKHIDSLALLTSIVPFTIQIAVSLGYEEIGLVGVDARYVHRKDVEKTVFDGTNIARFTSDNDPNHYRSDYHGEGQLCGPAQLKGADGNDMRPYMAIDAYCKHNDVKIYSCTEGSRLNDEGFEYKDYIEFID